MTRAQQISQYIREATDDKDIHIPAPVPASAPSTLMQHHPIYHTTYSPVFHSGAPQSSSTTTMTSSPGTGGSSSASPSYSSPTPAQDQDYTSGGSSKMSYSDNKPQGMSRAKHFLHGTALGAGVTMGGLYAYGHHLANAAKVVAPSFPGTDWT